MVRSLADTLMPEAFEHGRPLNWMATAAALLVFALVAALFGAPSGPQARLTGVARPPKLRQV